ncbi:hypothetical protein D9758_017159 [Tetrapyrgos nigripes]|uniref:Uncharacterized protein n=1 Tax=Tetrapyrgos nigripes TaxID=182062 RepID=A0A8H5F9U4_9AGAR|nr:hypothetical protein D9758_017159 [Tetrapyrgos nigripes]
MNMKGCSGGSNTGSRRRKDHDEDVDIDMMPTMGVLAKWGGIVRRIWEGRGSCREELMEEVLYSENNSSIEQSDCGDDTNQRLPADYILQATAHLPVVSNSSAPSPVQPDALVPASEMPAVTASSQVSYIGTGEIILAALLFVIFVLLVNLLFMYLEESAVEAESESEPEGGARAIYWREEKEALLSNYSE